MIHNGILLHVEIKNTMALKHAVCVLSVYINEDQSISVYVSMQWKIVFMNTVFILKYYYLHGYRIHPEVLFSVDGKSTV